MEALSTRSFWGVNWCLYGVVRHQAPSIQYLGFVCVANGQKCTRYPSGNFQGCAWPRGKMPQLCLGGPDCLTLEGSLLSPNVGIGEIRHLGQPPKGFTRKLTLGSCVQSKAWQQYPRQKKISRASQSRAGPFRGRQKLGRASHVQSLCHPSRR